MHNRLVFVTSSFPIQGDGSEAAGSFVLDMAETLAKHQPVLVVAPGPVAGREVWSDNIEILRFAAPDIALSNLRLWNPVHVWWIFQVLRGGLKATQMAASDGATQILAFWGLPCGEWARRVARAHGIGYSVWMLGSDVWSLGRIPGVRSMLARVIRDAAHAYADGYKLAEDAEKIGGVPVSFLPSARAIKSVRTTALKTEPPYRFLFLGRWHANKGIDLLLDALALLKEKDWQRVENIEIHGGGPMESLVGERVAQLQSQGFPVEVGGYLQKEDAEAAILRADYLIIPSRIESIPLVFSDAIKLRCPVLVTPVGDLPRIVSEKPGCGMIASAVSADAIAHLLTQALNKAPLPYLDGLDRLSSVFKIEKVAMRVKQDFGKN